ncbi:MAG TPA: ANTAR domain-containing protein [Clostridiales bacterium]|nr:ANTAR domain-containing protein [Clostridiales bacterium]
MGLQDRVYSILIVSAAENLNTELTSMLPETTYHPVRFVSNISAAKRELAERSYDMVLINSPLPDDPGIRFAINACGSKGTVVLLIVRAELHDEIYDKVSEHGVFTLAKPTSKAMISTALRWMASAKERIQKTEKKTYSLEEKMQDIRLVNRAKWLLISEIKMDEPEAHRYIEKQAMDRCVSKRTVAEEIIKTYT